MGSDLLIVALPRTENGYQKHHSELWPAGNANLLRFASGED